MTTKAAIPLNEALQKHADEYVAETGIIEFSIADLSEWALNTGRYDPPKDLVRKKCREEYSRALREQYITGHDGQPVRAKHVRRVKRGDEQLYLWADIRVASRSRMLASLGQRREQVAGECRQIDRDKTHWNHLNPSENPIQIVFDFTDDVEEGRFSGDYPPKQPR